MDSMSAKTSGAALSFKSVKAADPGAGPDQVDQVSWTLHEDAWKKKGYEGSRLLAIKEEDQANQEGRAPAAPTSVGRAKASAYLFGCCLYNCCCCCCGNAFGPWCGKEFCLSGAVCYELRLRREQWLAIIHTLCFCVHTGFAIASFVAGSGKPMEVDIFRVVPSWNNTGRNGYDFAVKQDFQVRIDTVTGLFFLLSATFHFVWVFGSICSCLPMWDWMISYIDDCFCFWYAALSLEPITNTHILAPTTPDFQLAPACLCRRFVEYSLSASLMLMAIGMITGLRDGYSMFAVFMLSFTTMLLGIITEMLSRPCGPDRWQGDPDPKRPGPNDTRLRIRNYMWRMFPHFVGWVPYCAAWFIVISNFFRQIDDLPDNVRNRIPWFVPWAIYGTALTFTSFAFVQARYQWTAPKHYWRSEIIYAMLSLTAKLYLGGLLYWNVILAGSFEDAIALENAGGSSDAAMPLVQAWHEAVRVANTLG